MQLIKIFVKRLYLIETFWPYSLCSTILFHVLGNKLDHLGGRGGEGNKTDRDKTKERTQRTICLVWRYGIGMTNVESTQNTAGMTPITRCTHKRRPCTHNSIKTLTFVSGSRYLWGGCFYWMERTDRISLIEIFFFLSPCIVASLSRINFINDPVLWWPFFVFYTWIDKISCAYKGLFYGCVL